jgi:hypothetical protein
MNKYQTNFFLPPTMIKTSQQCEGLFCHLGWFDKNSEAIFIQNIIIK